MHIFNVKMMIIDEKQHKNNNGIKQHCNTSSHYLNYEYIRKTEHYISVQQKRQVIHNPKLHYHI